MSENVNVTWMKSKLKLFQEQYHLLQWGMVAWNKVSYLKRQNHLKRVVPFRWSCRNFFRFGHYQPLKTSKYPYILDDSHIKLLDNNSRADNFLWNRNNLIAISVKLWDLKWKCTPFILDPINNINLRDFPHIQVKCIEISGTEKKKKKIVDQIAVEHEKSGGIFVILSMVIL